MNEDSVIQEVRAAREEYARSHGYDVRAMVADLRERDDRGDWPVLRFSPRRPVVPSASPLDSPMSRATSNHPTGHVESP